MSPRQHTAPATAPATLTRRFMLGLAVSFLGLLSVLVYLAYSALTGMDQRIAALGDQVSVVNREMEDTRQWVEEVSQRASGAEVSARLAAERGSVAEAATREAERRAAEFENRANEAEEALTSLERQRQRELDRLQKSLSQVAQTRRTALGVVMNLDEDFLQFDFDKATLRPRNRELLSRIAGILLTSPGFQIRVMGHTDDIGSDEYNMTLSERRARAVYEYLVEAGIDTEVMTMEGFGKTRPLVRDTSTAARAKNRRVEIAVVDAKVRYADLTRENRKKNN